MTASTRRGFALKSIFLFSFRSHQVCNVCTLIHFIKLKQVDVDVLKRKVVILFISDLDVVLGNEYMIVQNMYMEKRQNLGRPESQFEIVWVPITDEWTAAKYQQFENLRDNMEWYSVFHPSVVSPIVVRYIRDQRKWNFVKKPLLVVMDPQGKIVHQNAIHMMCIWGSLAYPFTSTKERLLWDEETWRIELLADHLHPNLFTWVQILINHMHI